MSTNPVDEWFAQKMLKSAQMSRFGSMLLIPMSLVAAIFTWCVLFVISFGVCLASGWSSKLAIAAATVLLALTFVWQFTVGKRDRADHDFAGKTFSGMEWAMIRAASSGWGVFIFDPELGGPLVRFVSAVFLTSPRMIELSQELKRRATRLERADAALCSKVVRRMVKTQKRVTMVDMQKNMPNEDLASLVQILTDVDGIIFLTKNGIGLTLAPRFNEEFRQWIANRDDVEELDDEPEATAPTPPTIAPDAAADEEE